MKNEIIIYQPNQSIERIEVKLEDETVWLNQEQMAILFNQTKQNISQHINNCYKENELDRNSTVKEYLTVQDEGRRKIRRKINYYNLDVVISVGYRVKSIQGTQFRIWANKILKDLGKKWFAFSRLDPKSIKSLLHELSLLNVE